MQREARGADPEWLLARTLYYPATVARAGPCADGADAFTTVRSPVTLVCRSFSRLSAVRAAVTVIHEALHFAGLPESPAPGAMTSEEINRLVWEVCF